MEKEEFDKIELKQLKELEDKLYNMLVAI